MVNVPDEVVYLAYALFVIGAILIVIGLARICWYCCVVRKEEQLLRKRNFYDNPTYFSAHQNDPWLKDAALHSNRLYGDDKGSLKDVNMSEFLHTHRDENAKDLSAALYQSLSPENRTHIDSTTVQNQASYEEPNTNLIIAMKEKHNPPEEVSGSSYGSNTQLVHTSESEAVGAELVLVSTSAEEIVLTSRSEEQNAVLSALDLATAGNTDLDTTFEEEVQEVVYEVPSTPHPDLATANEPLPGDTELYYSTSVYDQGSTEL